MKGFLTIVLFGLMIGASSAADISQNKSSGSQGSAGVDERYVDELKTKKSAIEKEDQRMEEKKDEPGGEKAEGVWKDLGQE
jgi:hypothetical protein